MTTPNEILMDTLRRALSVRRPHGSYEEGALITWLHQQVLTNRPQADTWVDAAGNLHVDMRHFDSDGRTTNTTLFVAHVDTVHRSGGRNEFDDSTPMWKADGKVALGADDGAGVAVLSALIHACKPAYYIFTRGEECGGVGSKYLATDHGDLLAEFDRAIAFDRKDVWSVITHQGWGRCCSDEFGEALADALNAEGMFYATDDGGVYTDTAEFVEIIPECTNLSAGYYQEHGPNEHLDTDHLQALCAAAIALDWDALPTKRDPSEPDLDDRWGWGGKWSSSFKATPKLSVVPTTSREAEPVTADSVSAEELDDLVFGWRDEAGVQHVGSGKVETIVEEYRGFEITVGRRGDRPWHYEILTKDGQEIDFDFGFGFSHEALAAARNNINQIC